MSATSDCDADLRSPARCCRRARGDDIRLCCRRSSEPWKHRVTVATALSTSHYDPQGRLVEAITGSENSEFLITETYEYGPALIRRRTSVIPGGGPSVTTQTLDANGRLIKEVVVDEATSTIQRTSEVTYDGNRKEVCEVSSLVPRRQCATTVQDSHGNEIELVAEARTRKMSFVYDSVGNWISKRTSVTGPHGFTVVTIEQRKIEYW